MPAPLPPRTLGTSREELVRRQEEALAKIERSVERKVEVEMSREEVLPVREVISEVQETVQEAPGATIGVPVALPTPEVSRKPVVVPAKRKVGRPKGPEVDRSEQKHLFVRDFPFEVKQRAKAMALLSGVSFRVFVAAALMEHCRRVKEGLTE